MAWEVIELPDDIDAADAAIVRSSEHASVLWRELARRRVVLDPRHRAHLRRVEQGVAGDR